MRLATLGNELLGKMRINDGEGAIGYELGEGIRGLGVGMGNGGDHEQNVRAGVLDEGEGVVGGEGGGGGVVGCGMLSSYLILGVVAGYVCTCMGAGN